MSDKHSEQVSSLLPTGHESMESALKADTSTQSADAADVNQAQHPAVVTEAAMAATSEATQAQAPSQPQTEVKAEAEVQADIEVETQAVPVIEEVPLQLPGELLAAKRLQMRLSLEDISARLKLAPRQLASLEANDFASLPGMASVRGFIRSYARALELDPEPLLAMVANEPNPAFGPIVLRRPLPSQGFPGRRYAPSARHRRAAQRMWGLAAVVLIFVGLLAYLVYRNGLPQMPSVPTMPNVDIQATRESVIAVMPWGGKSSVAAVAEQVTPVAPHAIDAAQALELKFREDAWVEILTPEGSKTVSRLMKAGSTELFEINEPIVLVVGNAAGVDATLRGQAINLRASAHDNVAKLNLK